MPLALVLFLALFYLLPLAYPYPLYQWLWVHARERLPGLMLHYHGALVWNGAFYAAMLLGWLLLFVPVVLFQWLSRRDDPAWGGLFAGFGRRNRLAYADLALFLLFPLLIVVCLLNSHYVHGPLSAALVVFATLLPGALPARKSKSKNEATKATKEPKEIAN